METLRDCVSRPRLQRYENACRSDRDAIECYVWNIQLAESFYPVLSVLEVALRNAVHTALSNHTGSNFWFGTILHPQKRQNIDELISRIAARQGAQPTADKVISEITFGFWPSLFSRRYNTLWWQPQGPLLAKVLPHHPNIARDTRKHLEVRLEYAVALRNRVMHHEAIFQGVSAINRQRMALSILHAEMRELVAWINPVADIMLTEIDRFPSTWAAFPDERVKRVARVTLESS